MEPEQKPDSGSTKTSTIVWPKCLTASRDVTYESLSLLYNETNQDVFGDHMAFAVACSDLDNPSGIARGCIHKLEVTAEPDFACAAMQVTHEVLPNQGPCSRIIDVNSRLKVACFDNGTIIPVKNFGFKKTFNCDVRAGLKHHPSAICSISADAVDNRLATGCGAGELALYQVAREEIKFITRSRVASSAITGLAFTKMFCSNDQSSSDESETSPSENSIIYTTQTGTVGSVDPRCSYGSSLKINESLALEQKFNISSLAVISSSGRQLVLLGGVQGQLVSFDLRFPYHYLHEAKISEDRSIRTLKEVVVQDELKTRTFLACTNESTSIKILDLETMQPHTGWVCERMPHGNQQDICQIDDRLVTCGDKASIGCWVWNDKENVDC